MSRVPVEKHALKIQRMRDVEVLVPAGGASLYVYDRGTTIEADGFTTENGSTPVTQPLVADSGGEFRDAWFEIGAYDLYSPDDILNPTSPWNAGGLTVSNTYNLDIDPGVSVEQGVDVWASEADPESVTDWGPIINALLIAGYKNLYFSKHDFPFSTTINLTSSTKGCVFRGAGSGGGAFSGLIAVTRLIWKGAGTGYAIDCGSAAGGNFTEHGSAFHDMLIGYDNASYTGNLIFAGSDGPTYERCRFHSLSPATNGANSLVVLSEVAGGVFDHCFFGGAQSLVRGAAVNSFSNQVSFNECVFGSFADYAICNPGSEWLFNGCCWEYPGAGPTAIGIGSDYTSGQSADYTPTITLQGCSFWDFTDATQQVIVQPVGVGWHFSMKNTQVYSSNKSVPLLSLLGPGSVILDRCGFGTTLSGVPVVDLGDVEVNGNDSRKSVVDIRKCGGGYAGGNGIGVTHLKGHIYVNVQDWGSSSAGTPTKEPQIRTVSGYERLWAYHSRQRPGIGLHSGYTGITVNEYSSLTDGAGLIAMGTGGSGAPAGLALDVTFGEPLIPSHRGSAVQRPYVAVILQPAGIETSHPHPEILAAAQPYVVVPNTSYSDAVTVTGFTIGFTNSLAANKQFALIYRVLQL